MKVEELLKYCNIPVKYKCNEWIDGTVAYYSDADNFIGITPLFFESKRPEFILLHEIIHAVIRKEWGDNPNEESHAMLTMAWEILEAPEDTTKAFYLREFHRLYGDKYVELLHRGTKILLFFFGVLVEKAAEFFNKDIKEELTSLYREMLERDLKRR